MTCDPLIAFGLVMVATADGRVAVYRIVDFELEVDEDVVASERRRRSEWEEEDMEHATTIGEGEEKKSTQDSFANNDEGHAIEHMTRRERSRDCVEPLLVVSLPTQQAGMANSEEEDSHSHGHATSVLPMIVAMCATPRGMSLIQTHDSDKSKSRIGQVAVLTDDGGVHVLEFLHGDFPIMDADMKHALAEMNDSSHQCFPIVRVACSFRSKNLGATCICMQPIFFNQDDDTASKNSSISEIRLCIGHECGALECYRFTSKEKTDPCSPYSLAKSKSNEIPRSNSKGSIKRDSPKRNSSFLSSHLAMDSGDGNDYSFDLATRLFRTYSEPTDQISAPSPASQQKMPSSDELDEKISMDSLNIKLCWRGNINAPIRSVVCLGWNSSLTYNKAHSLIAIGLMHRSSEMKLYESGTKDKDLYLSPAISLEVIDTSLAQEFWLRSKIEACKNDRNSTSNIPLSECSVWPAAGMEVKDGWTRDSAQIHSLQNLGLRGVSVTNKMCEFLCNR
jgi:hypothetical protein